MFFKTFESALYCLNFPNNTRYIYIVQCKGSYEYFERNDSVLVCIGQGPKSSPGHPSGNQYDSNQLLLGGSLQHLYPVFRIFSDSVEYVGNYRLLNWRKTISFEGFAYYEYKFTRVNYSRIARQPADTVQVEVTNTVEKADENPIVNTDTVIDEHLIKAVDEAKPLPVPVPVAEYKTYQFFPSCS
jgi:hypothetical protein